MNKTSLKFGLMMLAAASLASCTMQKRYHNSGWNVEMSLFKKEQKSTSAINNEHGVSKQKVQNLNEINKSSIRSITDVNKVDHILTDKASKDNQVEKVSTNYDLLENKKNGLFGNESRIDQNLSISEKSVAYTLKGSQTINNNKSGKKSNADAKEGASTHWASIVGMITGILGIFVFGIILGACGIIFSAIALSAIKKNPEKYKGKGMAVAGLVTGIVAILGWLLLVAILI